MNWNREASTRLRLLFACWIGAPIELSSLADSDVKGEILTVSTPDHCFAIAVRGSDEVATLERAVATLAPIQSDRGSIGLVAVPYMGPKARSWANQRGISWVDLSGNADVRSEGLRIVVIGQKNLYTKPGRQSTPFTPRFSRISRALLVHPDRWWRQIDLAEETALPRGTVSKAIQRLTDLDLLEQDPSKGLRVRSPSALLDAWMQRYRFRDHTVRSYHAPARNGGEALRRLSESLAARGGSWAATGLSAAWVYTEYADFRLNTFFVDEHPSNPDDLGLRQVETGANVWLAVPRDDGVFYGSSTSGILSVHPTQAFLDLQEHPERSTDAANELRTQHLQWRD